MGDVEFRVDGLPEPRGGPSPPEDVIDIDVRPVPRWLTVFASVVALVLVGAALFFRNGSGPAPTAEPPEPRRSASPTVALRPLPVSPVEETEHQGEHIALDVALADDVRYTLRYDLLTTTDRHSGRMIGRVRLSGLDYFYGGPAKHLFLDPASHTAWVLSAEVSPPRVLEFNSASLTQRRTLVAPGTIHDADVLDSRLYLATSAGVVVVTPGSGRPTVLAGADVPIQTLAADHSRGRLLAIDVGIPHRLLEITPESVRVVLLSGVLSPSLAVVDRTVWLAGYDDGGAVVRLLNPQTMQAILTSPAAEHAHSDVQLHGGDAVVWVSSGGRGGVRPELWCVAADTGKIGGYWPDVSGAVTSRVGEAYAVRDGSVVSLPTSPACPG